MVGILIYSRGGSNVDVDSQETATGENPLIVHTISAAQNGLVLCQPGNRPTKAYRRSKVVPVVVVDWRIGVSGVLADKLCRRQRASYPGLEPVCEAGARQSE